MKKINAEGAIRIGIVDDHQLIRDSFRTIYKDTDVQIQIEAENGKELIKKLGLGMGIDVLLLDINMPEMNGFDTMKWLKQHHKSIKVLVVTMHEKIEYVIKMFELGASGYITKNTTKEQLMNAVEQVHRGHIYVSNEIALEMINIAGQHLVTSKPAVELNEREKQFFQLISTEKSYKEISELMGLSLRTVDSLRMQLCERFECLSRVGLVMYGIKHNIIQLSKHPTN